MKLVTGATATSLCLMLGATPLLAQESQSTDTAQKIAKIESCIAYPVVVKNQPSTCRSLEEELKAMHVPGVSIAVVHHGVIEWARGYGVTKIDGAPVTTSTLFQAGSISKPVSAMAALHLVQQGKLSLDKDVNQTLRSWKLPPSPLAPNAAVTLRELLTHTAGLNVHGFPGYAANTPIPSLVQILDGQKPANTEAVRLERVPGTQWNYSGGGFTIMQLLLQDLTQQPFASFLHDTVLAPVGMRQSTFQQPLPETLRTSAATPYDGEAKPIEGGPHTYPEQAAAGLWTTPSDLARFIMEIQRSLQGKANHVLDPTMTRAMLKPGKGNWGLGIEIGDATSNPYFQHDGSDAGFQSTMLGYEDSGDGVAIMTNGENGGYLCDRLLTTVAIAYGWTGHQPRTRTAITLDRHELERYIGTYAMSPDYAVTITLEGDHLVSRAGNEPAFVMYAETPTKFFTLENLNFDFTLDEHKRASSFASHFEGSNTIYKGTRK